MAGSEQTNEEDERQYRRIEDWFARKEKLFWTEEASDGTWEGYVASGHIMASREPAVLARAAHGPVGAPSLKMSAAIEEELI